MHKKKSYFIVFEGVEGTGKSYQIAKLYKNLKNKKYNIIKTREPGGSKTAEKIRNLIFSKKSNNFDALTDFYLMCAARNEHVNKFLIPAKKQKKIIICDRFTDSTYAYQVIGNGIDKNFNNYKNLILFMGKNGEKVLEDTLKNWEFYFEKKKSITSEDSFLLNIKNIKKKTKN